jgi:2'-5' RNA ligase
MKFCLMLAEDRSDHETVHLTVKYLGTITLFEASMVCSKVSDFLFKNRSQVRKFMVEASKKRYYGPDRNIHVLVADAHDIPPWCISLRGLLEDVRQDEYDYSPHLTVPDYVNSASFFADRLLLTCSGMVVAEWKLL